MIVTMKSFSTAFAADRKALGLRQRQLAEALRVSQQAIARWETGQSAPRVPVYKRLVEFLQARCQESGIECQTASAPQPLNPALSAYIEDAIADQEAGIVRTDWKGRPTDPESLRRLLEMVKEQEPHWEKERFRDDLIDKVAALGAEWGEIPELRPAVLNAFGEVREEQDIKTAIEAKSLDEKWLIEWLSAMERQISEHIANRRFLSHSQRRERDGARLMEFLPAPLRNQVNVSVERGISKRTIDYFSNRVVAEIKVLHPYRPPSFSINSYASEVVDLLLAKTMSFGQEKEYLLLLIHNEPGQNSDLSLRMMPMVADCSALGIKALLLGSYRQAAFLISDLEGLNLAN